MYNEIIFDEVSKLEETTDIAIVVIRGYRGQCPVHTYIAITQ